MTKDIQPVDIESLLGELAQLPVLSIGRHTDNDIVLSDSKISGKHAQIIQCTNDSALLIDLTSKNGTFVNDVRITRKVIGQHDVVRLANDTYALSELLIFKKLIPATPQPVNDPIDIPALIKDELVYAQEFADLQTVFEQYPKLKRDCRNREKMIRTGSVILSSVIGISAALATGGGALPLIHILSSAGLSALIPTLCSTLLSTEEKLELIDKEYRNKYRCPNPSCRDPFGIREWEALAQQKTCRRCQAVWVR